MRDRWGNGLELEKAFRRPERLISLYIHFIKSEGINRTFGELYIVFRISGLEGKWWRQGLDRESGDQVKWELAGDLMM